MPSKLQIETARSNGANSHGPATPNGRAISSRNSLRHGLRAKTILIPGESRRKFQTLLDDYIDQFQPLGPVEFDLVQTMAIARWRLNRVLAIEATLIDNQLADSAEYLDQHKARYSQHQRAAYAFRRLADEGKSLALALRYEGALNRSFEHAFRQLRQLQSTRPPQPNEPKPKALSTSPNPPIGPSLSPPPAEPQDFSSLPAPKTSEPGADMRVGAGVCAVWT
jgi:hypothetical protein